MQNQIQIFLQLLLAAFLGSIIGLERQYRRKEAGLRTYSLVALGACLFTIVGLNLFYFITDKTGVGFNPGTIIQAIAVGIGFLGAGVILHQQSNVVGLTTAAGLWVAAAIGVTVAVKLYILAVLSSILIILIFAGFGLLEEKLIEQKTTK